MFFIMQVCLLFQKEHRRGQEDESHVEKDKSRTGSESGPGEVREQRSARLSITTFNESLLT